MGVGLLNSSGFVFLNFSQVPEVAAVGTASLLSPGLDFFGDVLSIGDGDLFLIFFFLGIRNGFCGSFFIAFDSFLELFFDFL